MYYHPPNLETWPGCGAGWVKSDATSWVGLAVGRFLTRHPYVAVGESFLFRHNRQAVDGPPFETQRPEFLFTSWKSAAPTIRLESGVAESEVKCPTPTPSFQNFRLRLPRIK